MGSFEREGATMQLHIVLKIFSLLPLSVLSEPNPDDNIHIHLHSNRSTEGEVDLDIHPDQLEGVSKSPQAAAGAVGNSFGGREGGEMIREDHRECLFSKDCAAGPCRNLADAHCICNFGKCLTVPGWWGFGQGRPNECKNLPHLFRYDWDEIHQK